MAKGRINRIIPFSCVDGPGNRTAIFLQGCNFNCLYCHNPETINHCINCGICVEHCPYGALSMDNGKVIWDRSKCEKCDTCIRVCPHTSSPKVFLMDAEEVMEEVRKVRSFIKGITVSGGECMLQADFLLELFAKAKIMGLTTFVDTNGSVPFWEHEQLLSVMDMAMVDVKSYDPVEHKKLTGKDNETVLKNVKFLGGIGKLYEIRTVTVPDLLDNYYTVDAASKLLAKIDPSIRYKLIKYRQLGVRKELLQSRTPDDIMMNELAEIAKSNGCKNIIIT